MWCLLATGAGRFSHKVFSEIALYWSLHDPRGTVFLLLVEVFKLIILLEYLGKKGARGVNILGPFVEGRFGIEDIDLFEPCCDLHEGRVTSSLMAMILRMERMSPSMISLRVER